ncbi:MAG: hypothetical protein FRX49_07418 [Trebouxia sp. A1-2]|nr:MAG: hypothetical protein FRX49_07418 [Trebouxia sp. A1-2]
MAEDGVSTSVPVQSQGEPQTASRSAPAIVITSGLDSMRFRPLTPSKEVLEQVRLKWAQGMIVDHEGFEVTPSSPVLDPGLYEYQVALPSGLSSPVQLGRPSPVQTRREREADVLEKAKTASVESREFPHVVKSNIKWQYSREKTLPNKLIPREAASEGEESRAVRKSLRNAQAALKASEAQDDKANASYDRLQSQLDAEKQTTVKQTDKQHFSKEQFEKDIAIVTSQAAALAKTLQSVQAEHKDTLNEAIADAQQRELRARQEATTAIQNAHDQAVQAKAEADRQQDELQQRLEAVQAELQTSAAAHTQLNSQLLETQAARADLELAKSTQEVSSLAADKHRLAAEADQQRLLHTQVSNKLHKVTHEHSSATEQLERQVKAAQASADQLQAEIADRPTEADLDKLTRDAQQLRQQVSELQKQHDTLEHELSVRPAQSSILYMLCLTNAAITTVSSRAQHFTSQVDCRSFATSRMIN